MNKQRKCKLRVGIYQNSLFSDRLSIENQKNYITAKDEKSGHEIFCSNEC